MKEFATTTTIHAPPEDIWAILLDAEAYPIWDPFCEKLEGEIREGGTLRAHTKLTPGRAFKLKVLELVPNRKMVWRGGMPLGLFKGVRTFTLTETDDGVEFSMREVFSGPMMKLIGGSIPDMTEAFDAFAEGLKARAENSPHWRQTVC